ncbi:MAG: hypothetical protein WKG01_41030 [Kofleriaceae bacterium]
MKRVCMHITTIVAAIAGITATARAQPLPDVPIPSEGSGTEESPPPVDPDPAPPIGPEPPGGTTERPADPYQPPPVPKPTKPLPPIFLPEALSIPTGWMLPAAVMYWKSAVDTGGGVSSDVRIGLGDVAEFGIETTDEVRVRDNLEDKRTDRIQPYAVASFRLGVAENRLFDHQPGVTLGFRKSFERDHGGFKSRIAELTLVGSWHLGRRAAVHVGGAFWDASMQSNVEGSPEITLHGFEGFNSQIRGFGGIEVRPIEKSLIIVDVGWAPEFCPGCTGNRQIRLRPVLSWGVRSEIARWFTFEAGVRVPEIGDANLLDAQIFGQAIFTSWALRRAVDSLK